MGCRRFFPHTWKKQHLFTADGQTGTRNTFTLDSHSTDGRRIKTDLRKRLQTREAAGSTPVLMWMKTRM